ncbi:siderophore [Aspergillus tanneri]|uniref:Siderophore n=1 Tax=Aspergillus tanneri TaxID=1220188 RepID=A0A5M9MJG7_9EURO|nr:siderophore [Aspergillus tanneri]KAA8646026.1 siderophore [Aspergillus tanneri]
MTVLTLRQEAWFQTTKRLLAALVNEGLVDAKVEGPTTEGDQYLRLSARGAQRDGSEGYLIVKVNPGATIEERNRELPLKTVDPENIPGMLTPDITFISIALTEVRFSGPFEELLQPLLRSLQIPGVPKGQTVVPCLTQQLPSILRRFPNAIILETIADSAYAQASLRTLTLRSDIGYPFQLKLSLACQITSALRTITPWSAMGGPRISKILVKFLPANLWVFREVASVTGSQADFDDAKHLSCILREDLEARAENNNEVLIIAAALTQQPHGGSQSYAEIIFGLKSVYQKQEWFRLYVQMLLELFLPPLVNHGIGLEAHGQNVVARVCRATGKVKGFAVRDFGGIRLHTPTLRRQGVKFDKMLSGWVVLTESMNDVLEKVHHSLLQNHIGFLLNSLCLERHDGWNIVRDVLEVVLSPVDGSPRNDIYKWFMNDTMLLKCFLRMRMQQKYRDL